LQASRIDANAVDPDLRRLVVGEMDREPEPLRVQPETLGD